MKRTLAISKRAVMAISACLALAVIGVGCPLFGAIDVPLGTAKVTTVFTADSSPAKSVVEQVLFKQGGGPLPLDQIESLVVTVEKVELLRDDEDEDLDDDNGDDTDDETKGEEGDGDGDDDGEGDDDGPVEVFTGSMDIDLVDLLGVSEILSAVEVPADDYKRIILSISNPRLVLASDPETVITDVMLTANGRVFVDGDFSVEDGESRILQIDLGGIHLVQTGSGKFVLTPQLEADIEAVMLEDVVVVGDLVSIDKDNDTFELDTGEGIVVVSYAGADIFPFMGMDPTGTEDDLMNAVAIDVEGTLQLDGSVVATSIRILSTL